jgi:trans-aconitate 2-methyltransferase
VSGTWDAATYDQVALPQARWGQAVVERLRLVGIERVLDAGCGTGRVTEMLLARAPGIRVVALDASPEMIGVARRRLARWGERTSFVQGDLLAGAPGPVDAVLSTATFHWIHDHDRLFASLAQALVPGGQMVAQCGGEGNIASVQRALVDMGARVDDTYFATPEQTEARLERSGFEGISCWLQPEPTTFGSQEELETFLGTVVLRHQLAEVASAERRAFVHEVAARLPGGAIDYVRLNILALRAPHPASGA